MSKIQIVEVNDNWERKLTLHPKLHMYIQLGNITLYNILYIFLLIIIHVDYILSQDKQVRKTRIPNKTL